MLKGSVLEDEGKFLLSRVPKPVYERARENTSFVNQNCDHTLLIHYLTSPNDPKNDIQICLYPLKIDQVWL